MAPPRKYPVGERRCFVCKDVKGIDEFSKNSRDIDGHSYRCKVCSREKMAKRKFQAGVSDRYRKENIQRRYGMTIAEYDAMVERQGNVCGICGRASKLVIDHCHQTGRVRGLLCTPCNTSLGVFGDTVEGLSRAITYLEKTDVKLGAAS